MKTTERHLGVRNSLAQCPPAFQVRAVSLFYRSETQRCLEMKTITLAPTPGKKKKKKLSRHQSSKYMRKCFYFVVSREKEKILPESFLFSPFLVRLRKVKTTCSRPKNSLAVKEIPDQVALNTAGANTWKIQCHSSLTTELTHSSWRVPGTTTGSLQQSLIK